MNKVNNRLLKFVNEAFTEDGSYTTNTLEATPSKKACKYCEFNGTQYCDRGVK